MTSLAAAEAFAPIVLSLIEDALIRIAPKLGAEVKKFMPEAERVVGILQGEDPEAVRVAILEEMYVALDAAVDAQLDKS